MDLHHNDAATDEHARKLTFGPFHDLLEPAAPGNAAPTPPGITMAGLNHAPSAPAGYERMPTFGPFHELFGPMYAKELDGTFIDRDVGAGQTPQPRTDDAWRHDLHPRRHRHPLGRQAHAPAHG